MENYTSLIRRLDYVCSTFLEESSFYKTSKKTTLKKRAMSKILIIGVGSSGSNTVQRMKEIGIPDANYITFNDFDGKEEVQKHDIPHYNLIEMNELSGISNTDDPKVFAKLAENVKDQIKGIIEYNFNKDANGLISKDTISSIDGLYLIECTSDNHTYYGLYKYRKGERLWKYFEDEYEHTKGKFVVEPVNITNIVLETDTKWEQGDIAPADGLYIVAYAFQNNIEAHYGYHASLGTTETGLGIQYDKKNYAVIHAAQCDRFLDSLIKSHGDKPSDNEINWGNAKILAFYTIRND